MVSQVTLPLSVLVSGELEKQLEYKRDLECAGLESDGTLIVWGQHGKGIEIRPEDQLSIVSLLLRNHMDLDEVLVASAHHGDPNAVRALSAFCNILISVVPGKNASEVVVRAQSLSRRGELPIPDEIAALLRLEAAEFLMQLRSTETPTVRWDMAEPVDLNLPLEDQVRAVWKHAVLTDCNAAAATVYGYDSPEECLERKLGFWEVVPPFNLHNRNQLHALAGRQWNVRRLPIHIVDKNDTGRNLSCSTFAVTEGDTLERLWGSALVLDTLGRLEDCNYFRRPSGVVVVHASGRVRAWDEQAENLLGYTSEEMVGEDVKSLWSGMNVVMARVGQSRRSMCLATENFAHREGNMIPVSVSVTPLYDPSGFVEGATLVITPLPHANPDVIEDTQEIMSAIQEMATTASSLQTLPHMESLLRN